MNNKNNSSHHNEGQQRQVNGHYLPPPTRQSGVTLVTAMLFGLVLALLGLSAITSTTNEKRMAHGYQNSVEALLIAESGIAAAIVQLQNGGGPFTPELNNGIPNPTGNFQGGAYTIALADNVDGDSNVNIDADSTIMVTSEGKINSAMRSVRVVVNRGAVTPASPWPGGIHGCQRVAISGSTDTDSYDSRVGIYGGANVGNHGDVSTSNLGSAVTLSGSGTVNGEINSAGSIDMSASATIQGSTCAGMGISMGASNIINGAVCAGDDITTSGGANINGNVTTAGIVDDHSVVTGLITENAVGTALPPVGPCDLIAPPGSVAQLVNDAQPASATAINTSAPATAGDYFSNSDISLGGSDTWAADASSGDIALGMNGDFRMSASSQWNINGPGNVLIWINGDFDMGGNSQINISGGANVTLYVTGNFNSSGNGIVNNGLPTDLTIISSGDNSTNVTISGDSEFRGAIYAPGAPIDLSANSDRYGAVRGQTVIMSGQGDFHYDEALGSATIPGVGTANLNVLSWQEL